MSDQIREPSRKTAPNVRLVDPLKTQAAAKAKDLGISLNALVSLAVRQYLDGQAAPSSQAHADDALTQILFAALDRELASPSPPRRAPRQPAASAVGGRGARLPMKNLKVDKRYEVRSSCVERQGDALRLFCTCLHRHQPAGLLGASFAVEYGRSHEWHDRRWRKARGIYRSL